MGSSSAMSAARWPEALTRCSSIAVVSGSNPVASSSQVRGVVSTTFGGVPRVCRTPSRHWTATNGGTRTSTALPGASWASARADSRTAAASAVRDGAGAFSSCSQSDTARIAARSSAGSTFFGGATSVERSLSGVSHSADLHVHTSWSDGTDSVAELFAAAQSAGLTTLGVTDHDTANHWDQARDLLPAGMRVLPGTEFSTKHPAPDGSLVSVHLLGYLFDRENPAIVAEWERMRAERAGRGGRIVENLMAAGFPITLERVREIAGNSAISRPHIGRALMEAGVVDSVSEAFAELLDDHGPYYAALRSLPLTEAIDLVTAAGGVPVLAHPRARAAAPVLTAEVLATLVPLGLRGLEADHPDHDAAARTELRGIADDLGLLATGSSDYHGENKPIRIGQERTADDVVERIIELGVQSPFV